MSESPIVVTDQPQADPITLQNNQAVRDLQTTEWITNANIAADAGIDLSKLESGGWDSYTPVLTAQTTNPTGHTIGGRYTIQAQNTCHIAFYGTFGAAAGSGAYFVSLPVTSNHPSFIGGGQGGFYDVSTGVIYPATVQMYTATTVIFLVLGVNFGASTVSRAPVSDTYPVTVAAGDVLTATFTYETA